MIALQHFCALAAVLDKDKKLILCRGEILHSEQQLLEKSNPQITAVTACL